MSYYSSRLNVKPSVNGISDADSQRTATYHDANSFSPGPSSFWKNVSAALFATALFRYVYDSPLDAEEIKARVIIEKKTVINLLEAFSVAVKHYLRGEDGIYYYAMPNSIPSRRLTSSTVQARGDDPHDSNEESSPDPALLRPFTSPISGILKRRESSTLPVPATSSAGKNTFSIAKRGSLPPTPRDAGMPRRADTIGRDDVDDFLLPAHMPPKYVLLDIFPFSLFIHCMSRDRIIYCDGTAAQTGDRCTDLKPRTDLNHSNSVLIWATLRWVTIPATVILAFIFFGFLVAGDEIEKPGDTGNELRALTAVPAPNIATWAFAQENNLIFGVQRENKEAVSPEDWVKKGCSKMVETLAL
ncbi:hypothetical protein HWV62_7423 [Athelia sp. TMB]|nr:hypothetical protein HWV62_7423 [Athelia sp. TMB]